MRKIQNPLLIFVFLAISVNAAANAESMTAMRSFDDIFPNLNPDVRKAVFSAEGYMKSARAASISNLITSRPGRLDPGIANKVLKSNSGYYVEAMLVIPGKKNLLDVYNAIGNIRDLKGRKYNSYTKGESVALFEEATRVESAKKANAIPDPPRASYVPKNDTVYIRLKDANFGNTFYRGDMMLDNRGIRYSLTNYKNLAYMLVPVIKEERFIAQLYFEIIDEGVFVYGITGAEVSDFVASKIDMLSAISKRLAVLISWGQDGLK